MKALASFLCFAVSTASCGQVPSNLVGLPVGPGGPGKGPWELKIWPYENCRDCAAEPKDQKAYDAARSAILSGDFGSVRADLSAHMILLAGGQSENSITLSELHERVSACKQGSEGLLKPNNDSVPGTSFGLGLDCPGREGREFLSITILNHRIVSIYYLPDGPIWVLNSAATVAKH